MKTAIDRIEARKQVILSGKDPKVRPGQPECFTDAATVGDCIPQGDLYLIVADEIPQNFKPKQINQLVPGNTQGARHCLDSLDGAEVFVPPGWSDDYDELQGPFLRLSKERTIVHPTHGDVTIPAGFIVECVYQREWDAEQARERRNAD